jgi:serine/threonine protein kinase
MSLSSGDIVEGKYRIMRLLGEGGMNRVYLVEDLQATSKWAMKVTKESCEVQASQQETYNKFLKEVSILMSLKHPNMPRIQDYFCMGSQYCIIEEYVNGKPLDEFIKSNLPSEKDVVSWSLIICDILETLHENTIIFRDLKPANLILTQAGDIKLIDFDIARYYKDGKSIDTQCLGTPGYAAPETYGKAQSDVRADIYSFGATLHHLLTGVDPQDKPFCFEPINDLRPGITKDLVRIVEKALKHKAAERFGTIHELKNELMKVRVKILASSIPKTSSASAPAVGGTGASWGAALWKWMKAQNSPLVSWFIWFVAIFIGLRALFFIFSLLADVSSPPSSTATFTPRPAPTATGTVGAQSPLPMARAWEDYRISFGYLVGIAPELKNLKMGEWERPCGSSVDIYHPTFIYYVAKMADPIVTLDPVVARDDQAVNLNLRFRVHFHPSMKDEAPWKHVLQIFFVMPLDGGYDRSPGHFSVIPGDYLGYTVRSVNRWSGTPEQMLFYVDKDESWVLCTLKWRPRSGVPPLRYSTCDPRKGPRVVINLSQRWYGWQYTRGFIIGSGMGKKNPAGSSEKLSNF